MIIYGMCNISAKRKVKYFGLSNKFFEPFLITLYSIISLNIIDITNVPKNTLS